jgi:hypothetical protein
MKPSPNAPILDSSVEQVSMEEIYHIVLEGRARLFPKIDPKIYDGEETEWLISDMLRGSLEAKAILKELTTPDADKAPLHESQGPSAYREELTARGHIIYAGYGAR